MKDVKNIDWSKSHNGVILCDYHKTIELMPEIEPVLNDLIDNVELEFNYDEYLIDVKVHLLKPNQFPCIPDWHCDFVPRDGNGVKDFSRITGEKMYLWVSGEPRTEFKNKPTVIDTGSTKWVEFTQNDSHRGVASTKHCWRCFVRLIPKSFIDGRPTGNKDTSHRGGIRRHSQVYLDSKNYDW